MIRTRITINVTGKQQVSKRETYLEVSTGAGSYVQLASATQRL